MSDLHHVCLAVFAKFPTPGKCKTRLIGELSAEQAAEVQEEMTRHTLKSVDKARLAFGIESVVFYSGCAAEQIQMLYGDHRRYRAQSDGDLGERMANAAAHMRQQGMSACVFIGTDCPTIAEADFRLAGELLKSHDVCISPATDGGYVLLGLNLSQPFAQSESESESESDANAATRIETMVFDSIDWGSERVLSQSLDRIEAHGLSCGLLRCHDDVDRPEDLEVWRSAQMARRAANEKLTHDEGAEEAASTAELTVVIPVYNHEPQLAAAIKSAQAVASEVIVVAAGTVEATRREVARCGAILAESRPGRAIQMNLGGHLATGKHVCFLHADSQLPTGVADEIAAAFGEADTTMVACRLRIDTRRRIARVIELAVDCRSKWFGLPYGDQALTFRTAEFRNNGGFPEQPLMEDYVIAKRGRRTGKIAILKSAVRTSDRRWKQKGYLKTTLLNQFIVVGFKLGVAPETLARWYRGRQ